MGITNYSAYISYVSNDDKNEIIKMFEEDGVIESHLHEDDKTVLFIFDDYDLASKFYTKLCNKYKGFTCGFETSEGE